MTNADYFEALMHEFGSVCMYWSSGGLGEIPTGGFVISDPTLGSDLPFKIKAVSLATREEYDAQTAFLVKLKPDCLDDRSKGFTGRIYRFLPVVEKKDTWTAPVIRAIEL